MSLLNLPTELVHAVANLLRNDPTSIQAFSQLTCRIFIKLVPLLYSNVDITLLHHIAETDPFPTVLSEHPGAHIRCLDIRMYNSDDKLIVHSYLLLALKTIEKYRPGGKLELFRYETFSVSLGSLLKLWDGGLRIVKLEIACPVSSTGGRKGTSAFHLLSTSSLYSLHLDFHNTSHHSDYATLAKLLSCLPRISKSLHSLDIILGDFPRMLVLDPLNRLLRDNDFTFPHLQSFGIEMRTTVNLCPFPE
ncbi:hypothetical protein GYMLUDRAFT_245210 [Collybiopsis luxurians FD-317 M1]|uniref:F-box domain-containing protein n=1 Tax=Collybiopsis luxurians FD-317 M1 TaxID=944289 RepID=A0A0D0BVJ3_9AGAR|nr:hypothetical protein GYMLUDRAFT_245210 [Collybiopsis luxurians FD-317 M1]